MKNVAICVLLCFLCFSCIKKEFRVVKTGQEKTLSDLFFTYTHSEDSLCLSGENYAQHAIASGNLVQMTSNPELLKNQETILDSTGILFLQNWFNNDGQKDCFNKKMEKEILNSKGASIENILTPINLSIEKPKENTSLDDFIYGRFFLSNLLSVYMITDNCQNSSEQEVPVSLTIDQNGEVINNRFLYQPQKAYESVIKEIIESPFFRWQPSEGNEYRHITITFSLYSCTDNPLFSLKEKSIEIIE